MKDEFKFFLRNLNDTRNLAKYLSKEVEKKAFISLKGDLGAGKTTFARYFVNAFSKKEIKVLSPTFPLVQVYEFSGFNIWHFDLYRLKKESEIFDLDYELALDDIILMEWPDRIKNYLPNDRIEITFNEDKNFNKYIDLRTFGNIKLKRKFK